MEANGAPALPKDIPEEVELLDESWLSQQTAEGARLTLLEPRELKGVTGAAAAPGAELARSQVELTSVKADRDRVQGELAVLERRCATERSAGRAVLAALRQMELRTASRDQRLRALECQLRVADAEANELLRALTAAERPFWQRLFSRS